MAAVEKNINIAVLEGYAETFDVSLTNETASVLYEQCAGKAVKPSGLLLLSTVCARSPEFVISVQSCVRVCDFL